MLIHLFFEVSRCSVFREILRNHFAQANFKIIDFSLSINVAVEQPEVQPEVGPRSNVISHEQRLAEKFQTEVVSKCSEDAIIFIYICGIQFPYEVSPLLFVSCLYNLAGSICG